jgi:ribosomal protein L7/L12
MYDYLPMLLIAAIAFGFYQLTRIQERLGDAEAKLDALLRHFGVEWGKLSEPSDRVKELASDPNSRIEAIKAYREQTGLGLKEAVEVIDGLSKK